MDKGKIIRGALLVAGTSIGGGMLALPVLTSPAGFVPSLFIYLICWMFMASTGLLFLEISLWMGRDANIISMAEKTLGIYGKVAAWILYLFLFYCLTLAYIVGVGDLMIDVFNGALPLTAWQGQLLFLIMAVPLIYAGARLVGPINIFLMLGLGISYVAFVFLGFSHVSSVNLARQDWSKIWMALPITFIAFAYQGIIPTLVNYMEHDVKKTRLAILIGSFLPLITYAIWQWLILGIVPAEGPGSLYEALEKGQNAVHPLKNILNVPGVYFVGRYFAFFALVTSFLGVTLGLMDFLADGFKIEKTRINRILLCGMILIPPLMLAFVYPHVFLIALDYAGGFGSALLLGLLPILMVWSGRYHLGLKGEYRVWGGRKLLVVLMAFVFIELICEIVL